MDIFDLSATLTLDSSQYEKGLGEAERDASGFGAKLKKALKGGAIAFTAITAGATALSGAFVKGIKDTAEYGDNVDKMSQKLGLSAEGFQKWDYVLKIAGTDINSMQTGLKTLTNKIDDAKNGGADAQKMFDKLGISMDELNKMSREEAFEATIKGFQGMSDSTERAALANDLFGKSGQNLTPLFNQSAKATEEQLKLAEDYGMIMPESAVKASASFEDSVTTMQMTMQGMKNRMMGDFLPSVTKVTDGLGKLFKGDMSGVEDIEKGIQGIVDKIADVLPKILEVGGKIILTLAKAIIDNAPKLIEQFIGILSELVIVIIEHLPEIIEAGIKIIVAIVKGLVQAMPKIIEAVWKLIKTFAKAIGDKLGDVIKSGVNLVKSFAKGIINAVGNVVSAGGKLIRALLKAIVGFVGSLISAGAKLISALIQGIGNKISAVVQKAKELVSKVKDAIVNWAKNFADAGKRIVEGIWKGISDGFTWIKNKIKEWVGNVKKFFKKLLGIKSPSTWARDEIGWNIVKGIALGIEDGQSEVEDALQGVIPEEVDTSIVSGGFEDNMKVSIVGAVTEALAELTPILQEGMVDAMDGIQVKLNSRNFGKLTREAVNGTI